MTRHIARAAVFALLMGLSVVVAAFWRPTIYLADLKPKVDLEAMIPKSFAGWAVDSSIVPLQPSPDLQKVIAETYDQTLARTYRNARGQRVMLSMAYGRNQHEGMNTHRPEVCYPAQGFPLVGASRIVTLHFGGAPITATRVVARQGARNEPITYWVIVGDKITTFGQHHKLATLRYGFKGEIPDGILMRVSSIDPDDAEAFAMQEQFIQELLTAMTPLHRAQLIGGPLVPA